MAYRQFRHMVTVRFIDCVHSNYIFITMSSGPLHDRLKQTVLSFAKLEAASPPAKNH